MGFRTLAVTQRSSEVWKILEAVKTEFNKFADQLERVDQRLDKARSELQTLRTTRTSVMQRSLRGVGVLDDRESRAVLELPDTLDAPDASDAPDAADTPDTLASADEA
jgi:DNA recombination protein RmuC